MSPAKFEEQFKKLTEVGTVARGKSKHRPRNDPALYGGAYPFIQTGDVKHSSFYVSSYSQTYNEKGLSQSKLWQPGTLCITIAANIADTAILKIPACFPDSIIGFTAKPGVSDVRFAKYCLDSYKGQMKAISQGTTQDNMSLEKLLSIRFRVPSYDTQKKIAAILSAYDDLIENNRRRIALLEKMAEEIYREWFVRMRFPGHELAKFEKGVPVGWRQAQLGDIADINLHSIKRGREPEWIEYLDISSVSTNQMTAPSKLRFSEAPGRARRLVNHGDVIWSSVRPGNRAYCLVLNPPEYLVASTGFAVMTPKNAIPFSFLHRAVTTDSFVEEMVSVAKGAAYPATSFEDFEKAKTLLPDAPLLKRFHGVSEPLLLQADKLRKQVPVLAELRDMLLPRLISGKLAVEALDIRFPPSMAEPGNGVPEAALS